MKNMGGPMNEIHLIFAKLMEHTSYLDDDSNETALVDVNQRDWAGDTPLHMVTRLGWNSAISILINEGAQVNLAGERGLTALHYAAYKNDMEGAAALLAKGADPHIKDEDGRSPIDWAISARNEAMISLLRA
jgi:ankyrin repeat protein